MVSEDESERGVKKILERAILVKEFMEAWSEADSLDQIHEQVREKLIPEGRFEPYMTSSFKFLVKGYGKSINSDLDE